MITFELIDLFILGSHRIYIKTKYRTNKEFKCDTYRFGEHQKCTEVDSTGSADNG